MMEIDEITKDLMKRMLGKLHPDKELELTDETEAMLIDEIANLSWKEYANLMDVVTKEFSASNESDCLGPQLAESDITARRQTKVDAIKKEKLKKETKKREKKKQKKAIRKMHKDISLIADELQVTNMLLMHLLLVNNDAGTPYIGTVIKSIYEHTPAALRVDEESGHYYFDYYPDD